MRRAEGGVQIRPGGKPLAPLASCLAVLFFRFKLQVSFFFHLHCRYFLEVAFALSPLITHAPSYQISSGYHGILGGKPSNHLRNPPAPTQRGLSLKRSGQISILSARGDFALSCQYLILLSGLVVAEGKQHRGLFFADPHFLGIPSPFLSLPPQQPHQVLDLTGFFCLLFNRPRELVIEIVAASSRRSCNIFFAGAAGCRRPNAKLLTPLHTSNACGLLFLLFCPLFCPCAATRTST